MISNPVSISLFIHVIFIILIVTGLPTFDKYDDEIIKAIEIELVSSTSFEDESEEKNKEKEISEVNTKKYSSTPNIKPSMRSENSSNMDVTDLEEEVTLDAKIDNEEKVDKEPKEVFSVPKDKPKLNKINDKFWSRYYRCWWRINKTRFQNNFTKHRVEEDRKNYKSI